MPQKIYVSVGIDVDAVGGWLGSYGGEDGGFQRSSQRLYLKATISLGCPLPVRPLPRRQPDYSAGEGPVTVQLTGQVLWEFYGRANEPKSSHDVVRQSARIRDRLTGRLVRAGMREIFRCVSWGGGCPRVPGKVPRLFWAAFDSPRSAFDS